MKHSKSETTTTTTSPSTALTTTGATAGQDNELDIQQHL